MEDDAQIGWLLQGDVSIAWQASKDLCGTNRPDLRALIPLKGWGKQFLAARNPDGTWGRGFYVPRWTCSHYVLQDLFNMGFPPDDNQIQTLIANILDTHIAKDGGLGHAPKQLKSDTCINGMFLAYASYFSADIKSLKTVIDFLLSVQLPDGGFNCQINRRKVQHSSLHTTLSVLEGIQSYQNEGYTYRQEDLRLAADQARAFILLHKFFKSDRTGKIINKDFLKMPYPPRWCYNTLRALDHFQAAGQPYVPEMDDALLALLACRRTDGLWPRTAKVPGAVFFAMEPPRGPSRWNTLIAMRVLKAYPRESNTA